VVTSQEVASTAPEEPRYAEELAEEIEELASADRRRPSDLPPDRYIDRETSWLDFNARILELAEDVRIPLLERVRFAAIFAGNLDEFFMVRVATLKRREATGIDGATAGVTAREQLHLIAERAHELATAHGRAVTERLLPALATEGIQLLRWKDFSQAEQRQLRTFFQKRVYPVLTPLAVDPAHPFPYISGLSLNLAVILRDPDSGREHFARLKVPPLLPRFVDVGGGRYGLLEDIIAAHLPELFPGVQIVEHTTFRVTRNEDVELEEEDETEDLLRALERELARRRFGPPVRLEIESDAGERVLDLLVRELGISGDEVYRLPLPLGLVALWAISDLDRPSLKYTRFVPATHPRLRAPEPRANVDLFGALRAGDILVHHPYDSFSASVLALLQQAAADPSVLAIKQTLYRTSGDSTIVDALIDAAESGKQVLVVVEIKARFDEQANIRWARALEQAGCHVVYGLVGLKTHAKMCLVVRQEPEGMLRRYVHIGTGNYNPKTARIYEDLGLLSADPDVGADVAGLFNHLSGYTRHADYRRLLVAPDSLRSGILDRIEREIGHAQAGRSAGIRMKLNALVDEDTVDALYRASLAGVPVRLVVRGICALRPGVPGLSERISVRSIVGRFLEHSRILCFHNDGEEEVWIGSADVMHRNLDRRVEAMVQICDTSLIETLSALMDRMLAADVACWELCADGQWRRRTGGDLVDLQEVLGREADAAMREVPATTP
jgi:polyphosphate kinase